MRRTSLWGPFLITSKENPWKGMDVLYCPATHDDNHQDGCSFKMNVAMNATHPTLPCGKAAGLQCKAEPASHSTAGISNSIWRKLHMWSHIPALHGSGWHQGKSECWKSKPRKYLAGRVSSSQCFNSMNSIRALMLSAGGLKGSRYGRSSLASE